MLKLSLDGRVAILSAIRDKLVGGNITLLDDKRETLAVLEIGDIAPVVDDALVLRTPIDGRGEKYGFASAAVFESKDNDAMFETDVTKVGDGGTVELESTEIVQGAIVKINSAVFTIAG